MFEQIMKETHNTNDKQRHIVFPTQIQLLLVIQWIFRPNKCDEETTRLPIPVVKDITVGRISEFDSSSPCIADEIDWCISGLKAICLRVRSKILPSLLVFLYSIGIFI